MKFVIENRELLRTPYCSGFFFESIKIFVKREKYKKHKLFQSAIHGHFLLHLGDQLIKLLKTGKPQHVHPIDGPHTYEISLDCDDIIIKIQEKHKILQKYIYPKDHFIIAIAQESKQYLQKIKKINPRIVLEDQYSLLASCYIYFDRNLMEENSSFNF